jgi:flagellar assembly factor FliW
VGANEASQIAILAIVTLSSAEQGGCTVNLQGPLAFNLEKKQAKQIAVANSDFGVRYPIDLSALAEARS